MLIVGKFGAFVFEEYVLGEMLGNNMMKNHAAMWYGNLIRKYSDRKIRWEPWSGKFGRDFSPFSMRSCRRNMLGMTLIFAHVRCTLDPGDEEEESEAHFSYKVISGRVQLFFLMFCQTKSCEHSSGCLRMGSGAFLGCSEIP